MNASRKVCVTCKVLGNRAGGHTTLWVPHYGPLLPTQKKLLGSISAATLDRMLAERKAQARQGKSGTRPGSL